MYVSQDWVDLVNFDFHSQRRPKILNICVLQNLDMYMLRNVVDLVDFDFHSQRRLKFLIYVCQKSWLTRLT